MWKGCAFANAARNGVFATLLANLGMTGPDRLFEGEMGFFRQVCGESFEIERFGGGGEPFMIDKTYIKNWPAEYHSQSAIDAALAIVEERGKTFAPDEIDEVVIGTFQAAYDIIGKEPEKWHPRSRETADHSLPYVVCAALVDGEVTQATYDEARLRDEALLALLAKTRVECDSEFERLYPSEGIPNRVSVKLTAGPTMESRVTAPLGHALNPMSDAQLEAKFHSMADRMLTAQASRDVLEALWSLDAQADLGEVLGLLVV